MSEQGRSAVSVRIYRVMLLAYPGEMRRRYGLEMADVFRQQLGSEGIREGGFVALAALWLRTILDWGVNVIRQRGAQIAGSGFFGHIGPIIVALVFGLCGSWVDFHTDEPTVLCALMFLFGLVSGAAFGLRRGWPCGIVMGASLPLYFILKSKLGLQPTWAPEAAPEWATLVTIVPATLGVLLGWGTWKAIGVVAF